MNTYYYIYSSPVGVIQIIENGKAITLIKFINNHPYHPIDSIKKETLLIKEVTIQLKEYFASERTVFDVPIEARGSDFQKKVWSALCTIPYGETRSYKEIAKFVNCPKGARAVGMANNRNPISIIIPCHRVIGADGSLTGYATGLHIKQQLLQLEQILPSSTTGTI